jgi:branched-chain amino acid transport system permease protein
MTRPGARTASVGAALIALLILLPLIVNSGFALTVMTQAGVAIIFALAFNMLLGQGGMLSFGHAVYFGLAGYVTAHVMNGMANGDLPYMPVSLIPLVGGVAGLFFGILIGFVSTRRAGTAFAMISLGFAELATALTLILVFFFNGEEGVQTDRWVREEWFGITYGPDLQVYYLVAIWCVIASVAMYAITRTPFGRMCNAVRDNPERVQFIGYSTHRVRWLAFSLSSFFAGMAGALHAVNVEHVGFETVGLGQSAVVLIMVYIGGTGIFAGPILGAILVTLLTSYLSDFTPAWYLYLGVIFVAMVMFAPGGLAGLIMMHDPIRRVAPRLFLAMLPAYGAAFGASLVALAGALGVIEMLYILSTTTSREAAMILYGIPLDAAQLWPWLICIALTAAGGLACARTYPRMAESYNAALFEARKLAAS